MSAAEAVGRRPFNVEAEQALLGAIFVNNAAYDRVCDLIRPEHFSEPVHGRIYELAETLIRDGKIANPVTLKGLLPAGLDIAGIPAPKYLARLASEATTVINAADYADTIRGIAGVRAGINLGDWLATAGGNGMTSKELLTEFYRRADEMRLEFMSDHRHADTVSASEAAARVVEELTLVRQGKVVPGKISTGLPEVDGVMGGLYRGDLVIAGGRPGQGKTTLGLHLGKACASDGKGAGMFSLEMPERHITSRLLADLCASGTSTDMPYQRIIDPRTMTDAEHQKIVDAQRALVDIPFSIDATSKLTLGALAAKIRGMRNRIRARWGVELWLVIVDYIKFLQASDRYFGDRVREVGEISGGLKQIAKDEDICIVALNQLNRQVEQRANKRPELSDLRESGDLEQDADQVFFVYRDAYYLRQHPEFSKRQDIQSQMVQVQHDMEIDCAKNRMGPTGRCVVWCNMATSSIRSNMRRSVLPEPTLMTEAEMQEGFR